MGELDKEYLQSTSDVSIAAAECLPEEAPGIAPPEFDLTCSPGSINTAAEGDSIDDNIFGSGNGVDFNVDKKMLEKQFMNATFQGADSEKLKAGMLLLYSNSPASIEKGIKLVSEARGLDAKEALFQYEYAMYLKEQGRKTYEKNMKERGGESHQGDDPSPDLNTEQHPEFTASNAQLRFGKILGDVFGIDAVFGSLISPTGGIVGPGNSGGFLATLPEDGAVAVHGAIHDAAGYLYNCHDIGPGYDYLGNEKGEDPGNPFSGQTNINWWIEKFEENNKDVEWSEKILGDKAYILAAFSKDHKSLDLQTRKEVLEVIVSIGAVDLALAGFDDSDRISHIEKLFNTCSEADQKALAKYYFDNDRFGSSGVVAAMIETLISNYA